MDAVLVKNADRMMMIANLLKDGVELRFADGRKGLVPFADIPEVRYRAGLANIELPNPYELVLTTTQGERIEIPWDFARHYCDESYKPSVEALARRGRKTLGERIRHFRESAELSQEALAHAANIGRVTLIRLEQGNQSPRFKTLTAVAQALGRPVRDLLTEEGSISDSQILIVFDHDGTLVDSSMILYQAYRHVADLHGLPRPLYPDVVDSIGYVDQFTLLFESKRPEYVDSFLEFYYDHHLNLVRPFDGIATLLGNLRKEGCKLGVASNKLRKAGLSELDQCGLLSYFDKTVYREDVDRAKPDPQGIHLLQEQLGVQPLNVVLVGDTEVDIQCARNAGVKSIAALWGYGDESRLVSLNPDASSPSPADVKRALVALF